MIEYFNSVFDVVMLYRAFPRKPSLFPSLLQDTEMQAAPASQRRSLYPSSRKCPKLARDKSIHFWAEAHSLSHRTAKGGCHFCYCSKSPPTADRVSATRRRYSCLYSGSIATAPAAPSPLIILPSGTALPCRIFPARPPYHHLDSATTSTSHRTCSPHISYREKDGDHLRPDLAL